MKCVVSLFFSNPSRILLHNPHFKTPQDDANNPEFGQTRGEELDHEALAKMTSRDREAAIK